MTIGRIPSVDGGIQPTIVTTKGDLIAATAASNPARLAVGNNGETLVADSSTSTGLRYQGLMAAGKNVIINGAMDIWQRGTSFTVPNLSYLMDRFYNTGDANLTVTQDTDVPTNPYFTYSAKCVGTATESFAQKVESFNSVALAGQSVTISLYAKKTAGTGALNINLYYPNVKDTYGAVTQIGSPLLMSSNPGSSWTRYSVTTTLPADVAKGLLVLIDNTNSHTIFITGVQVELGSVATAFSRNAGTIQGELAACQRYYVRIGDSSGASNQRLARGSANSTTGVQLTATLPVTLRTGASSTVDYANLQWYNGSAGVGAISSVTMSATSTTNPAIAAVTTGVVSGTFYELLTTSTAGYIGFSAEL